MPRSGRRRNRKTGNGSRSQEQRKTGPRRLPNKLFIGNLAKVTKNQVEDEFRRFGRLQDVWLSRKPSGFAFVEFLNSKDASKCVQALDGHQVLGTRLRVEFAKTETSLTRQAKREKASSSSRSRHKSSARGLDDLMLGSPSTRLLPPPKPTTSLLAPVYDRTPSPLVVIHRGSGSGLLYDDVPMYRSWDRGDQVPSSVLLPSVRDRSRSPRPRSPLTRLPAVDPDMLSSSGRLLAPPLPAPRSSFPSTTYVRSPEYTPPHIKSGRYGVREERRSAARYKSRSPLPVNARSRSPARAQSGRPEPLRTRRPPSGSPIAHRPRERLLGKTPPPLPTRSRSSSPPSRYGHAQAASPSPEVPKRRRSKSPLAYSSRNVAGTYASPSPQPKARVNYEKKYSMSPVRKRNSPPPKAYALSSNRPQSPRWSRSRSKSVGGRYSSASPVHQTDNRSSSSTSPPRYGKSPAVRENGPPPVAAKREPVRADIRQTRRSPPVSKHNPPPMQRYHRTSASPVAKRQASPVHHHASSPALRRRSPSIHNRTTQRHASPEASRSRLEYYRTSAGTQSVLHWSPAPKRSDESRKPLPVESSRNGRSPLCHGRSVTRSDRVRSGAKLHSSSVSRDRRSPRHR